MAITHVFFDLPDVLIDSHRLRSCVQAAIGTIMAVRYGGQAAAWTQAYTSILNDWDSYSADLDFSGDDGLDQFREALYRTTRALFRLTGTPEPSQSELAVVARDLPGLAALHCQAAQPDANEAVTALYTAGITLGAVGYTFTAHLRGMLYGAGWQEMFQGPIVGADTAGQIEKDAVFYGTVLRLAGIPAAQCAVVSEKPMPGARAAGMTTILLLRESHPRLFDSDYTITSLGGLLPIFKT
ncbi:MAG: hypothetical protein OHK0046_32010 [Anaerolineae bacterium]